MKSLTWLIIFLSILIPVTRASSKPETRNGTIKWSYKIRGVVTKGGVALGADGTVYAGDEAGFVYAVKKDGSLKWEINLNPKEPYENFPQYQGSLPEDIKKEEIPDSIILPDGVLTSENLCHSSPTLTSDGKKLYIGGINSGNVYCINAENGSVVWKFNVRKIPEVKEDRLNTGGGFCSSPAIGDDGTIYIGSGDWWGDQWREAQRMGIDMDKVIKRRFSDKRLYAVNPDGTLKWIFELEATDTFRTSIFACPAIGPDGTIYFGGFNGIFYALKDEGDKAKELWRYEVKGEPLSTAPTKYQEFWGSAAVAADGTIYVGNNDYNVYAFNPDGTVKWKFKTHNEVYQSVTIGGEGTIYIASEDRNLYALNPDGTLKWSKRPVERGIPFTVTVAEDETIIFGVSGRDRIIALDGKTGEFKWQSVFDKTDSEDGTSNDHAIGPDGTVYVYAAGRIYAVNGSSPLSTKSSWPKVNKDNRNSGNLRILKTRIDGKR